MIDCGYVDALLIRCDPVVDSLSTHCWLVVADNDDALLLLLVVAGVLLLLSSLLSWWLSSSYLSCFSSYWYLPFTAAASGALWCWTLLSKVPSSVLRTGVWFISVSHLKFTFSQRVRQSLKAMQPAVVSVGLHLSPRLAEPVEIRTFQDWAYLAKLAAEGRNIPKTLNPANSLPIGHGKMAWPGLCHCKDIRLRTLASTSYVHQLFYKVINIHKYV